MKIVHVTQFFHPQRGYQENHLSILQQKDGHEVTIICTDDLLLWGVDEKSMIQMDKEFSDKHNIKIIRLHKVYEFSTRIFVKGLKGVLSDLTPDLLIIHAVSLPMSLQAMKWGAKNHVKMIVDDHMVEAGSFNKSAKYFYAIFRKLFPIYLKMFNIKVDKWVGVSDETKEFMLKNYGIQDEVKVIPLGYDDSTVFKDIEGGEQWLLKNNLPSNVSFVLYIGKFDNMKDPVDLIEPFKQFRKSNSKYKLLMVGDPSEKYKQILKQKIQEQKVADEVYIVKSVPNDQMRRIFSVVEMTIWPHGSSMAMLEAMACECPVIAPNIQVNQERLSKGRGVMFEENSVSDLVKKMEFTLANKEKLTIKAQKWVNEFAWSKLADEFIALKV